MSHSVANNQARAGFILSNWGSSLTNNTKEFLDGFCPESKVIAKVQVNETEDQSEFTHELLITNEQRSFTPTGKVNYLSLKLGFENDAIRVKSEQMSTLKPVKPAKYAETSTSKPLNTSVVVVSKADTAWTIENRDNKLVATALEIDQIDRVGQLAWNESPTNNKLKYPINVDLKTRLWSKNLELEESISLSSFDGQNINPLGLKPEEVNHVLRYWSGYCTNNQQIINEYLDSNTFVEEHPDTVEKNIIADIQSLSVQIFADGGKVWVKYHQVAKLTDGSLSESSGAQKWSIPTYETRLHPEILPESQNVINKKRQFCKLGSLVAQEHQQRFGRVPEAVEKMLAENQAKEAAALAEATANQSYLAWGVNVLSFGYLCQPVVEQPKDVEEKKESKRELITFDV